MASRRKFRVRTLPARIDAVSGRKTLKIDTSIILTGGARVSTPLELGP